MSADNVTPSTALDAGGKETETREPVSDDRTEILSVPPEEGGETTVWCRRSPSPAKSTVAKRGRSAAPPSTSAELVEEGKSVKRIKFALTPSPPLRAVKVEVEADDLLEDALNDSCGESSAKEAGPVDMGGWMAEAESSCEEVDDDDDSEDGLGDAQSARNGTQHTNMSGHMAESSEDWLLDPAVASKSGMLVTIHGTLPTIRSSGWHNGAYEDAQGVVLSVFNTGPGNAIFASTARVRFLKPLDPDMHTFVVPVSFLQPVKPDGVGQEALIIGGEYAGSLAKLREEPRSS
ncbi:hypothetical protein K466DRAFT_290041 [Polyporus arcularius HHB13444]|uniref:Uncharacterized protein n=1 Tax=Polyporus arcularius HHB13444 TaxID=1314778 RepID=A0A5C3P110_9APHY|nr:hypothetical protein K466DRAFT_290041 [Polyporus arcularius HHB13444]